MSGVRVFVIGTNGTTRKDQESKLRDQKVSGEMNLGATVWHRRKSLGFGARHRHVAPPTDRPSRLGLGDGELLQHP